MGEEVDDEEADCSFSDFSEVGERDVSTPVDLKFAGADEDDDGDGGDSDSNGGEVEDEEAGEIADEMEKHIGGKISVGEHIIVKYDDAHYPRVVLDIEPCAIQVNSVE